MGKARKCARLFCQNFKKRLQGFLLTVHGMVTCIYHLNSPAAFSVYGWRYHARCYCTYANGFPCLFCLRTPLFTLHLKLLHPCVTFLETNYGNALQQVLRKLWFIYYLYPLSLLWQVLVKKLYLLSFICCFTSDLLGFINILRYTAHYYMTVPQSIILNC